MSAALLLSRTVGLVKSSSESLAVKYRPKSFSSVVGQKHAVYVLKEAIKKGMLPQQLLFSGGSGLGKTTLARICAASVLCLTPLGSRENADPCGECESCKALDGNPSTHPDLVEFDAASHGGKDEIKDIAASASLAPMLSGKRVYIIDEVHGLSGPGGQAFLKLLEEPPEHVIFMLCTTDPHKMLKTNRGRCVEIEMLPPSSEDLVENLRRVCRGEGVEIDDKVLEAVVSVSDPELGVRGTLMNLARVMHAQNSSIGELFAIVGVPSSETIDSLWEVMCRGDALRSLSFLEEVLLGSSTQSVSSALAKKARVELLNRLSQDLEVDTILSVYSSFIRPGLMKGDVEVAVIKSAQAFASSSYANYAQPGKKENTEKKGIGTSTQESAAQLSDADAQAVEKTESPVKVETVLAPPSKAHLTFAQKQVITAVEDQPAAAALVPFLKVKLDSKNLHIAVPKEQLTIFKEELTVFKEAAAKLGLVLRYKEA